MKRLKRKVFNAGLVLLLCSPMLAEDIRLLPPQFEKNATLLEALKNRCSERSFSEKELSLQQLSNLLWAAVGVNRPDDEKRTAPTARNAQEIDVYVAMKTGLYLYNAKDHILVFIHANDIRSKTGKQKFTETAPVNLIYVADFDKMNGDEETKIFYSATDTGFISQNVYLYCAAEGLGTVVRGWVDKDKLAIEMKLRPEQHITLAQTVGYIKQE
ncbi:SagB/ThcOx family dehydrogenase [bacterium]|nr:SagB/ThcOx family dehydrogenase [bacterium]MBU1065580.1 SagB/ThcOx family dehydrogenase [bacterium]MBU1633542.1 SagB/ThcOx family dehydrogenase [bacterium]MBU1872505.1 SagB/ThcOx family dehydrogenase [bacterium]